MELTCSDTFLSSVGSGRLAQASPPTSSNSSAVATCFLPHLRQQYARSASAAALYDYARSEIKVEYNHFFVPVINDVCHNSVPCSMGLPLHVNNWGDSS